ncbi:MAG: anaerobic ribonucleoside-triphosphate reductase activating protein [Desulfarculus sp.]|jgi:pyruvate formate lyase activating enzyme|nr:MAG: anaerobic ribonucleoside-triphosphate reductase activating protein [Desulfarculus sp.]
MPSALGQPAPPGPPPVKGFIETSFLDWPGQIASVFFLPGCNFRCPYCHNFTLVEEPDSLMTLSLEAVLDRLRPFAGWIDGVVVTGGEPTLHPGLDSLLEQIKQAGFRVKLDTNGYRPQVLVDLVARGLVDMVAMDLKAPLEPLAYRRVSGKPIEVEQVRQSLEFLKACGLAHQIRSTICPAWHGPAELAKMAAAVAGAQAWTLQALDPAHAWDQAALAGVEMFTPQEIARLQAEVADPACAK